MSTTAEEEAEAAAAGNVVELDPKATKKAKKKKPEWDPNAIKARWGSRLAVPFSPVSRYFLHNYYRLRPHEGAQGLTSTEAMTIIHILDFKWDDRAPFPPLKTIAKRMGLTVRAIRDTLKRLEELKYVRREPSVYGGPNRYYFDGLLEALHQLQDEDAAAKKAASGDEDSIDEEEVADG